MAVSRGRIEREGDVVATIGTFDGVHVGHRRLIDETRRQAAATGLGSVAITFDRHPMTIVRPDAVPRLLTGLDHKLELLRARRRRGRARVRRDPRRPERRGFRRERARRPPRRPRPRRRVDVPVRPQTPRERRPAPVDGRAPRFLGHPDRPRDRRRGAHGHLVVVHPLARRTRRASPRHAACSDETTRCAARPSTPSTVWSRSPPSSSSHRRATTPRPGPPGDSPRPERREWARTGRET